MTRLYALRLYSRALARHWAPRAKREVDRPRTTTTIWDGLTRAHYVLTPRRGGRIRSQP